MNRPILVSREPLLTAAVLWGIAGVWYLASEGGVAAGFRGYSYARNYISDLGVTVPGTVQGRVIDSPLAAAMNANFILHGVLFALAGLFAFRAVTALRGRGLFLALAVVHGVGIVLVGTFHGSEQAAGNLTGVLHVVGATMAIIGGNAAVIVAGGLARRANLPRGVATFSRVIGIAGLLSLLMLIANTVTGGSVVFPDGIWERLSVYSITLWELAMAGVILAWRPARTT